MDSLEESPQENNQTEEINSEQFLEKHVETPTTSQLPEKQLEDRDKTPPENEESSDAPQSEDPSRTDQQNEDLPEINQQNKDLSETDQQNEDLSETDPSYL